MKMQRFLPCLFIPFLIGCAKLLNHDISGVRYVSRNQITTNVITNILSVYTPDKNCYHFHVAVEAPQYSRLDIVEFKHQVELLPVFVEDVPSQGKMWVNVTWEKVWEKTSDAPQVKVIGLTFHVPAGTKTNLSIAARTTNPLLQ